MDALKEYSIPVHSLGIGVHEFSFNVDWNFFQHFEASPVEQGRFDVKATLDKQADHWIALFDVTGALDTDCDRCLAPIALPVRGSYQLVIKFEDERIATDTDEVIYVARDMHVWKIAQFIYEFILLSIPVSKTYDCEAEKVRPCDEEMLKRLEQSNAPEESNPIWDVLKQIEEKN